VNGIFDVVANIAAIILTLLGIFFFVVGTVGILRLPDFYCRTHAATKCDTLGAGSILLGVAVYKQFSFDAFKILLLFVLIMLSSPTAGHAISRAAYRRGLVPWKKEPGPSSEEVEER
jgi:monovalent cation/proton antiporter MnhG/PhaG subunit